MTALEKLSVTERCDWKRCIRASSLKPKAKIVWEALEDFQGSNEKAWPTIDTLVKATHLPRRTLTRHLTQLYGYELVTRRRRRGANHFRLLDHPMFHGKELVEMSDDELQKRAAELFKRKASSVEPKMRWAEPPPKVEPKVEAAPSNVLTFPTKQPASPPAPAPEPKTDLERAQDLWRAAMAKTYPKIPVAATRWKEKTKPGEHAQALLDDYGFETVEKYFAWVVLNWSSLVKRFENSKGFPAQPQVAWAHWKAEQLIGEAMGAVEASPMQQAMDVYAEADAWYKAHPGKLLPAELSARLANAPKIAGQKL